MAEAKQLPQYIAVTCICIGALGAGTAIAWTSNITDDLKKGELADLKMDDDELGWVGSCLTIGAMIMCFPIGFIANAIGRKPTCLLCAIPFIIGWVLTLYPLHIAMIYGGRILVGIGAGSFCVTAPMYATEIAQIEIRGRLGIFLQLFITIGILYSNLLGWLCPMMVFNILCTAVPVVFVIVFIFQPESPYYQLRKGYVDKAEKSLKRLRGKEYDISAEIKQFQAQIQQEQANTVGFWPAMKTKAAKKATILCFTLMFIQQLSGINAVMMYSKEMFIDAKSSVDIPICVVLIGLVQVVATVISSWAIEKIGRKILMLISCGVAAFSLLLLGIYFSLKNHKLVEESTVESLAFIPITALLIYIVAFSFGLGPIPWLASAEVFPNEVKAHCSSAAGTFNWFLAFLVTRFYLPISVAIGNDMTFYIFLVIMLLSVVFLIFFMPETKGKTFQEIQDELNK